MNQLEAAAAAEKYQYLVGNPIDQNIPNVVIDTIVAKTFTPIGQPPLHTVIYTSTYFRPNEYWDFLSKYCATNNIQYP